MTTATGADLEAYLAEDRRAALASERVVDGRVEGAALFADISGFTPLTETLAAELGPQRGAEELTATLDRIFEHVVEALHEHDGAVISFSGDAVTCWLDGDDGLRAVSCGLAMQRAMAQVGTVVTPAGSRVVLAMKVAVAVGRARRFVVGDPDVQLLDVLAGELLDVLAATEGLAQPGQVVVDRSVVGALSGRVQLEAPPDATTGHGVVRSLVGVAPSRPSQVTDEGLPPEVVRPWLLRPVYDRLSSGRGDLLAELRPAIPVFLRFGGLDFDGDEGAPAALDAFVVAAQQVISGYGGSTLQITVGDKGAYLYAVFGSPVAHEDDAARACGAALDLLALEGQQVEGHVSGLQVGVGSGRVHSGTCGHPRRRTFTCLGDAVNVSARLMSKAPPGTVYVSAAVRAAAGAAYAFDDLEPLNLKGKAQPLLAAQLVGRAALSEIGRAAAHEPPPLVGRDDELDWLRAETALALGGHGRLIGISGDAGSGKSRLAAELVSGLVSDGQRLLLGVAQPYGAAQGYAAWRPVVLALLGLDRNDLAGGTEEALRRALPEGLLPRLSLLGPLLGVSLPDSDLTAGFDPKLRKSSLEDLVRQLLRAAAAQQPLVVVLEDAHLLDVLSQDLLVAVAPALPTLPVAVVLAYRPGAEPLLGLGLERLAPSTEVVLDRLSPQAAAQVVRGRLHELFGADTDPSPEAVGLLVARADGNPLYVRELCAYLHELGVDPADPQALTELEIPTSLQSLVLSRIDRLEAMPRSTAKVASVVGRVFAVPLVERSYELGSPSEVAQALVVMSTHDLAAADDLETPTWAFSHAVVRDVAYESIPFGVRTQLHARVGESVEAGVLGDPQHRLEELAHHFWHSDDPDRKRRYLLLAGIAAQDAYANATALTWFRRLLPLLPAADRPGVLVRTGKVLEIQGAWSEAEVAYTTALEESVGLEDQVGAAWARTWLAEVARKQGRYDEARTGLASAAAAFAVLGDDAGSGQVLHLTGTLAAQQGDYDGAEAAYRESLALRERLGDLRGQAALLSNLAIVQEYRGEYAAAEQLGEQALALRVLDGDRWGLGVSHNNLGMLAVLRNDPAAATERFTESMRLHRECGDAWMVALGENNLGNARRDLGEHDLARGHYRAALTGYRVHADEWALAILYEDVAALAAVPSFAIGQNGGNASTETVTTAAARLLGASDALRERLGSPRAPDVQAQVEALAARLKDVVGPVLEQERRRGREVDGDEAAALVLMICGEGRTPTGATTDP